MNKPKYTYKDFLISLSCSLIFTFLSICLYFYMITEGGCILSIGAAFWIYMFMYFLLPLLLMAAWSISVEHYVYLELDALGDRKNKRFKLQVYSGVISMIAYGIMLLYFIVIGGEFLTEHWLYIDELSKWVGILAGMTLLCIIGLICIITQRRKINTIVRSIVVMVVTISIVLALGVSTKIYMEKAEEEAFWIRLHKSVEFTEEYGPYVENPYSFSSYRGDED